jgi:hypothetical protein
MVNSAPMLIDVFRVRGFRSLGSRPRFIDLTHERQVCSVCRPSLFGEALDRLRPFLHLAIVFA